jgi:hypothetical protein
MTTPTPPDPPTATDPHSPPSADPAPYPQPTVTVPSVTELLNSLDAARIAFEQATPTGHLRHQIEGYAARLHLAEQDLAQERRNHAGMSRGELDRLRRVEAALIELGAPNHSTRDDPAGPMITWIRAQVAALEEVKAERAELEDFKADQAAALAELIAERDKLTAELATLKAKAVVLPEDWRNQVATTARLPGRWGRAGTGCRWLGRIVARATGHRTRRAAGWRPRTDPPRPPRRRDRHRHRNTPAALPRRPRTTHPRQTVVHQRDDDPACQRCRGDRGATTQRHRVRSHTLRHQPCPSRQRLLARLGPPRRGTSRRPGSRAGNPTASRRSHQAGGGPAPGAGRPASRPPRRRTRPRTRQLGGHPERGAGAPGPPEAGQGVPNQSGPGRDAVGCRRGNRSRTGRCCIWSASWRTRRPAGSMRPPRSQRPPRRPEPVPGPESPVTFIDKRRPAPDVHT